MTVHKRPSAAPVSNGTLGSIAPTLTPQSVDTSERPFYPTKKQTEQKNRNQVLKPDTVDRRLPRGRKGYDEYQSVFFTASDIEIYAVMSVTRDNPTAIVLLREGIRTAEDAAKFLSEEDRAPLADDRSEMATKALARRIDADTLIEFGALYNPALWHSGEHLDHYLDAVELYSYPKFQQKKGPLFTDILSGKIRLSDIKAIGIRTTHLVLTDQNHHMSPLYELADGTANYTAEQLGKAFKTASGDSNSYQTINMMCQRHGGDWAEGIDWNMGVPAADYWGRNTPREGRDYEEQKEFITYVNEFSKRGARPIDDMYALFKAGVSVGFAAERAKEYNVQQVVALHEGISLPVTEGWL